MLLQDQLQEINTLTETKGQELVVLAKLPDFRAQAETENDWNMVAQSFWQEHLAHQHLVMNNQDPDSSHRAAMLTAATSGHQIVIDHQLNPLLGASHRFLGRANTYNGQHDTAKNEYEKSLEFLKLTNDPRLLEVTGFLSESLVRTGNVNQGLDLAFKTFDSYHTDDLALLLKKTDEYTYTVWRTGIFPRLVTALHELSLDYDKVKVKQYLEKSQELLKGQEKYGYRISEIQKTLATLGTFLITFVKSSISLFH